MRRKVLSDVASESSPPKPYLRPGGWITAMRRGRGAEAATVACPAATAVPVPSPIITVPAIKTPLHAITANGIIRPCLFNNIQFSTRELGIHEALEQAAGRKPERGTVNMNGGFHNIGG